MQILKQQWIYMQKLLTSKKQKQLKTYQKILMYFRKESLKWTREKLQQKCDFATKLQQI